MSEVLTKEQFLEYMKLFPQSEKFDFDYLYDVYSDVFQGLSEISSNKEAGQSFDVVSSDIIFYLLGEYLYSIKGMNEHQIREFVANESYRETMSNVVADKYISLGLYNHNEQKLTNKYFPPISSIELYVNLMLNIVNNYSIKNKDNALLVDLLYKTLSIARCILNLLCDGYETEAFAMWRTLHECECILLLLDKYREQVIPSYIRHMQYGVIYHMGRNDEEDHQKVFDQIKQEMNKIGLKSKDLKKYIEYGWLLSVPGRDKLENFKLNFRDGIESLAGLHQYSDVYMTSSEILHASPMLIYANKSYFHLLTLVNLYESFFRVEQVFQSLFFVYFSEEAKARYLDMRKLYFSQLISIHKRETANLRKVTLKK